MQVVPFRDAIQPNQSAHRKYKQHKLYCNPFVLFHISIMFRFMVLLLFYGYLARKTLVHSLYMPPSDCKAQEVRLLHVLVGENSLVEYVEPSDMLDEFLLSHRKLEGIVSILYVTDMGMVNLIYRYR